MLRWNIMGWINGVLVVVSAAAGEDRYIGFLAVSAFVCFAAADIIKAIGDGRGEE